MTAQTPDAMLSVIVTAYNEERYIGACLDSLLAQDPVGCAVEIIVSANACHDRTEEIVAGYMPRFATRGWTLRCLSSPIPGKPGALNRADAAAQGAMRAYLDADIVCEPALLAQVAAALATDAPRYATGRLTVARAKSWLTRAYARLWCRLPFMESGAVGAGLFAVNAAGRARWDAFPDIISDDTYARLQFAPQERVEVAARFHWPMAEGLGNLVRVRRRQDAGVVEIARLYPAILANEGKAALGAGGALRLALTDPVAFVVYATVHVMVRTRPQGREWSRGR
ncbi:glycosyltransferase family A protein [Albidovulum sediminicola]|uniref:Glycosyltransferase n=1 Tax=Albidovulum sediminicola TaxID=2984331 RepID=A0ABT2YZ03_9RHOB|nr:glycosyltransferase [Defluviimonas sp. WL0075]MCV2864050.1 glycosyltransferase [Defluviimonas sp. WL0075]